MQQTMIWPEGHRSAAMVTVELDAEFIWLGMDPNNIRLPKTLSMGEYGMRRGLDRLLAVFDEYDVKATFFVLGEAFERYGHVIEALAKAGHEIAVHGFRHSNFGLLSAEEQRDQIAETILKIEKYTGVKPAGFRIPEGNMTPDTLCIAKELGLQYDSSLMDSDLPYVVDSGKAQGLVEIPMRWDMQDFPYFCFNFHPQVPPGVCRIANYTQVLNIWQDELDAFHDYGLCYVIKFDPQSIGGPGRISMVDSVISSMREKNMWIATGSQIAEHTIKNQK